MQDSDLMGLPRDLDVAKKFSQAQPVVNGARGIGLQGQAHDKEDGDICSKAGFYAGLKLIMRLKEGALLVLAPECKTFGFASRNQHKRIKENVEGDTSWSEVEAGSLTQDMERQIHVEVTCLSATCKPLWHQQLLSLPRQLHGPCKHVFYCLAVLRGVEAALDNPAGSIIFTHLSEHLGPNLSLDRRADSCNSGWVAVFALPFLWPAATWTFSQVQLWLLG